MGLLAWENKNWPPLKKEVGANDAVEPPENTNVEDCCATDLMLHYEPPLADDDLNDRLYNRKIAEFGFPNSGEDATQASMDDWLIHEDRRAFQQEEEDQNVITPTKGTQDQPHRMIDHTT